MSHFKKTHCKLFWRVKRNPYETASYSDEQRRNLSMSLPVDKLTWETCAVTKILHVSCPLCLCLFIFYFLYVSFLSDHTELLWQIYCKLSKIQIYIYTNVHARMHARTQTHKNRISTPILPYMRHAFIMCMHSVFLSS